MANGNEVWKPGSFTKNFSWGDPRVGLIELHQIIRLGFGNRAEDIPRDEFRQRIVATGRPDYIPINFFLFNRPKDGVDYLCVDEMVFQAINWDHSPRFDKLALFAFNLSFVGRWKGASADQRRPALWANAYVRERVASGLDWNTSLVSADDIERFVKNDPRYKAATTRKLATNLNYLFLSGRLNEFPAERIERWWVDCLFLALDRIIEDRLLDRQVTDPSLYQSLLIKHDFLRLTGRASLEKELAIRHLALLYTACGGRDRFSEESTKERVRVRWPEIREFAIPNDSRPRGAVHPTNPRILKSIPAVCAMLARYAGFEEISPDELESFDIDQFIRDRTKAALDQLKERDIRPTMTAEEILKLTREK